MRLASSWLASRSASSARLFTITPEEEYGTSGNLFQQTEGEKADMVKHLSGGLWRLCCESGSGWRARQSKGSGGRSIDELLAASAESLPAPEACTALRDCTRRSLGYAESLHLSVWFRVLESLVML
jgi:hypothetical protein